MMTQRSHRRWFSPLAVLLVSVLAPATPAQAPKHTLEALLPQDTFLFASFSGLEACSTAAEGQGLLALWREPAIQAIPQIKDLVTRYHDLSGAVSDHDARLWDLVKTYAKGPIAVAASGMSELWAPMRDSFPIPIPGIIVALDVGASTADAAELLSTMIKEHLGDERSPYTAHDETVAGHPAIVLRARRYQAPREIYLAFVGNLLLATQSEPLLTRCLERARDQVKDDVLGKASGLTRGRSKHGGTPLAEIYLNFRSVTSRLGGFVPDEWHAVLHGLGLDAIGGIYVATGVQGAQAEEILYVDAPLERRGLLAPGGGPIDPKTLDLFPENTVVGFAARLPAKSFYDTLTTVAREYLPARERGFLDRALASLDREFGASIRNDLLATFGDEIAAYAELGKLLPGGVVSIKVTDMEKAKAFADRLITQFGRVAVSRPFKDYEVFLVESSKAEPKPEGDAPAAEGRPSRRPMFEFKPAYCFAHGRLLIATGTPPLNAALSRLEQADAPRRMVASATFKAATEGIRFGNTGFLFWADLPGMASRLYNLQDLAEKFGARIDSSDFDTSKLPPESSLVPHLRGFLVAADVDQDGMTARLRWPVIGTMLAVAGRVLMEAPGVPPVVLGRLAETLRPFSRGGGSQGGNVIVVEPEGEGEAPAESTSRAVNPTAPGSPEEAAAKARLTAAEARVAADPANPVAYDDRAMARHLVRDFHGAIADWNHARGLGSKTMSRCAYNIACAQSLLGDAPSSLLWMKTALDEGFRDFNLINSDSDLDNARKLPEFRALVEAYSKER